MDDHYSTLQIGTDSSPEDIRKAFKKKAKECHPDSESGDIEEFKRVNEAFRVLSNPELKYIYDLNNLKRVVNKQSEKINEIYQSITVSLSESLNGCEKKVRVNFGTTICSSCSGSGCSDSDNRYVICDKCSGHGKSVDLKINSHFNIIDCPACNGKGLIPLHSCSKCHSTGKENVEREISIQIPPGMGEDQVIRFEGVKNQKGLFNIDIGIKIGQENIWSREGQDLKMNLEINMIEAYIGRSKIIIDPYGREIEAKIPPGSQTGDFQFFRGLGVKNSDGDMYIYFSVITSKHRNSRSTRLAEELLEEIEKISERGKS